MIKKFILLSIILLLSAGCVKHDGLIRKDKPISQTKNCVQVLIIIYDSKGIFEEANFYIGELKKSYLPIYKGTVHNLELIGHPPQITTQTIPKELCKNPIILDWGFYQIWYGSQLVVGEGYGNTIYVRNINFLPLKKGGKKK
jgi:hypothetical protein